MTTIRGSLMFSFAEKYGSYALSLVGTVVLSRLLIRRISASSPSAWPWSC